MLWRIVLDKATWLYMKELKFAQLLPAGAMTQRISIYYSVI